MELINSDDNKAIGQTACITQTSLIIPRYEKEYIKSEKKLPLSNASVSKVNV
jgi:hypothetical protein